MDETNSVRDSIDEMLDVWGKTLPDMDMTAVGIGLRISRLSMGFAEDMQKVLRPFGIGEGEMDVLFCLLNTGEPYRQRPSDISKGCYVTTGATTSRVDRLIKMGLVERVPPLKDRRELLVQLTSAGRKLAQKLRREVAVAANVASTLNSMGPDDSAEFVRLLRIFHAKIQQLR